MDNLYEFFKEFGLLLSEIDLKSIILSNSKYSEDDFHQILNVRNRTIISRLYYYIFLKARAYLIKSLNSSSNYLYHECISLLQGRYAHILISKIFEIIDKTQSNNFAILRALRNSADYIDDKSLSKIGYSIYFFNETPKFMNTLKYFLIPMVSKIENKIETFNISALFKDTKFIDFVEDLIEKSKLSNI